MKEPFNDNEIDNLFAERLSKSKVEPSGTTWENLDIYVNNKLHKRKRRRAIWFWFLTGLFVVTISSGVYRFIGLQENNKNEFSQTAKQKDFLNEDITPSDTTWNQKNKTVKPNNVPNEKSSTGSFSEKITKPADVQQASESHEKVLEEISSERKAVFVRSHKIYQQKNKELALSDENSLSVNIPITELTQNNNEGKLNDSIAVKGIENGFTETQIRKNSVTAPVKNTLPAEDSTPNQLSDKQLVNKDSILPSDSAIANKIEPQMPMVMNEITANSFSRFFAELTFAPQYVNRYLKDNSNTSGRSAEYYNSQENPVQPTYLTEVNLGYSLTDKWKLKAGLGYTYFSQISNLVSDTLGGIQSSATTSSISTSSGTIEIPSSLFGPHHPHHPEKTPITYRTSEKYEYLTIPLLSQYNLKTGKTSWVVLAGMSASVLMKSTLKLEANGNNPITFNSVNGLQKTNFSFVLGFGLERDLWNRFYFSLLPMVRCAFTPINKGISVKSYPYFIGLQTGFGYKF